MNHCRRFVHATLLTFSFNLPMFQLQQPAKAQQTSPTSIWIEFQRDNIADGQRGYDWITTLDDSGRLDRSLSTVPAKISGITVPVFIGGECLYTGSGTKFKADSLQSVAYEQSVTKLIKTEAAKSVPVYLAINVLDWSSPTDSSTEHHKKLLRRISSEWLEKSRDDFNTDHVYEYGSISNVEVRTELNTLVREVATKFPHAAGIALDMRPTSNHILGFSDTDRANAIFAIETDPVDLTFPYGIDNQLTPAVEKWLGWRESVRTDLLKGLISSYKSIRPSGHIIVFGNCDYYSNPNEHALQGESDWIKWEESGLADHVIISGAWQDHLSDYPYYAHLNNAMIAAGSLPVPIVQLKQINLRGSYSRQWTSLNTGFSGSIQPDFVIGSPDDLTRLTNFIAGKPDVEDEHHDLNGTSLPDWELSDLKHHGHAFRQYFGHSSFAFLAVDTSQIDTARILATFQSNSADFQKNKIASFILSNSSFASTVPPSYDGLVITDSNRQILSLFAGGIHLIQVDRAGFIREVQTIKTPNDLADIAISPDLLTQNATKNNKAPDFRTIDSRGSMVHLSDELEKRNVLLVFLSDCLTCPDELYALGIVARNIDAEQTLIIAVSPNDQEAQNYALNTYHIDFPFVSDPALRLSTLYSDGSNENLNERAVLIDKSGTIRQISGFRGTESLQDIESILSPLKVGISDGMSLTTESSALAAPEAPVFQVIADDNTKTIGPNQALCDFGKVCLLDQTQVEKIFHLHNVSGHPLEIAKLEPSCHCTSASVANDTGVVKTTGKVTTVVVPTGQEVDLRVIINLAEISAGIVRKAVGVYLKGQNKPCAMLGMSGLLSTGVEFSLSEINFGRVEGGEEKHLTLSASLDPRLIENGQIPNLTSTNSDVHVIDTSSDTTVQESPKGKIRRSYTISLSPDAPYGLLAGRLSYKPSNIANVESQTSTSNSILAARIASGVHIEGDITGPVYCSPELCMLQSVDAKHRATQQLILTAVDASQLRNLSILSDNEWVTAKITTSGTGALEKTVVAVALKPNTPPGAIKSDIKINLNNGKMLMIPVLAYVAP
jgi:peroxiredoxin